MMTPMAISPASILPSRALIRLASRSRGSEEGAPLAAFMTMRLPAPGRVHARDHRMAKASLCSPRIAEGIGQIVQCRTSEVGFTGGRTMTEPLSQTSTGAAVRRLRPLLLLPLLAMLPACQAVVLAPAGDIAAQ